MTKNESARIETLAAHSTYSAGVMVAATRYCAAVLMRHMQPGPTLELGPAEGVMTDDLARCFSPLTVVEGASTFCKAIQARHPRTNVVNALFEEFRPDERFSNIVLGHVLEHVEDPISLLTRVRSWLAPGGRVLAAVPNSRSLHRQAAVQMGLLPFEETLNDKDVGHGHRRVYNPETLRRDFLQAGLSVLIFGGYWMKPLSNGQIEATWTPDMVTAFMALGERYPDIAAEIYVVAGNH